MRAEGKIHRYISYMYNSLFGVCCMLQDMIYIYIEGTTTVLLQFYVLAEGYVLKLSIILMYAIL